MLKLLGLGVLLSSSLLCTQAFAQYEAPAPVTPQMLAGDSQFLGEYVVSKESTKDHPLTDLCPNQADYPGKNLWCGRKVWAYQSQTQGLILIDALKEGTTANDMLSTFDVEGKSCKSSIFIRAAIANGIFGSNLCALATGTVGDTWTVTKPTTAIEAEVDSVTFIFGLILGSHRTNASFQNGSPSTILFEDIYGGTMGIDDKMTLTKTISN